MTISKPDKERLLALRQKLLDPTPQNSIESGLAVKSASTAGDEYRKTRQRKKRRLLKIEQALASLES